MLVHLFGWTSSRLLEIRAFCKERDIALVEDGAQCFGVEAFGKPVLAEAGVATLSFYPAKVVGGAMDGGAVTMQSKDHEAFLRSICNHGRSDHYSYAHVGWNSRMGGLQAAFLSRVLDHVPAILESRRRRRGLVPRAHHLRRGALEARSRLRSAGRASSRTATSTCSPSRASAARRSSTRSRPRASAPRAPTRRPMDVQPPAKAAGAILHGDLRHSKAFCESVVNLPLFYGIRDDERETALAALSSVL